jgi:hypothetical protein
MKSSLRNIGRRHAWHVLVGKVEEAGGEVVEEAASAAGGVAQVFVARRRGAVFGEEGQDGDDSDGNVDPASTIPKECRVSLPFLETSRSAWRQF